MATVIRTDRPEEIDNLDREAKFQVYNGLDSAVTLEVCNSQKEQLGPVREIYDFEMACMAPALELALRGTRVDLQARNNLIEQLKQECEELRDKLNYLTEHLFGGRVNPDSQKDLPWLFYDSLKLPKQWTNEKGERKLKFDRATIERLSEYLYGRPFARLILAYRDRNKKIQALSSGIHPDERMRCNYNVGATESGRWSSSKSSLGGGANDQTWTEELRHIFVPDPGMVMFNLDLEQAEARAVAYLSGDEAFIEACESGDLWTTVSKMIWPELGWTGDLAKDKEIAEQPFYRHRSYRYMSKTAGHAFDYMATAYTVAQHTKIDKKLAQDFQRRYFQAFPGVPKWQKATCREVQEYGYLTTPFFKRRRYFLGRLNDEHTLREAVSYRPQSLIGDLLNYGLLRLWRRYPWIEPLKQVHDSVVGQFPEGYEQKALDCLQECFEVYIPIYGREMKVPVEVLLGWNWGKVSENNPAGLKKAKHGPGPKPPQSPLKQVAA